MLIVNFVRGEQNMSEKTYKNLTWNFNYDFNNGQHSRTKYIIYKIENTLSGKIYIGQTKRMLFQRWADYKYNLLKPIERKSSLNTKLKNSVKYYYEKVGNVNFLQFSIVEIVDNSPLKNADEIGKLLCDREEYHIKEYKKIYGTNKICNIFETSRNYNYTNIVRENISKSKKLFYKTKEGEILKLKLKENKLGTKATIETKKKLSESHKGLFAGIKHPLYGKKGIQSSTYGLRHSKETKKKMSENRKRKNTGIANPNTKTYFLFSNPLVSPTGERYIQITNLNEFCKQHNLYTTHLRNIIKSKPNCKSHKGWKLQSNVN